MERRKAAQRAWENGFISNYDYLMEINTLAGRSFNDISQWPVMPQVIADYESQELNLDNPATYRDISRPMGTLDEKRLGLYRRTLRNTMSLSEEEIACLGGAPYMYGHLYTHSGVTSYFLWRLEPYVSIQRALQSGQYETPSRQFFSTAL